MLRFLQANIIVRFFTWTVILKSEHFALGVFEDSNYTRMSSIRVLNESSMSPHRVSVSIADECECKGTAFNPFLEALKRKILDVNTYKANRLYYTSICVRW